eukprot:TRINITY_DN2022_c0_g1_i7.p1 TRINITY_DN2022_c0_g1~~TRINITY_DN2022_c0_g1_i7.p1  ORF type:complete len:282 (+),score=62.03 TRINITY_DN2022_c0_g1_i7:2-847(+)
MSTMTTTKQWYQRRVRGYDLFEKFDQGIKLDKEGWFSVTPEVIARHIAQRFFDVLGPNALVVDAMAGVGGNTIQFATKFPVVFGIDISFPRLLMLKHNATIYGVQDKIELVRGDYTCIAKHWRLADAVFLSPPWGGPTYTQLDVFNLCSMIPDGEELFKASKCLTSNISYLLPRQTSEEQLMSLAKNNKKKARTEKEVVRIEELYVNERFKMLAVYYGSLAGDTNEVYPVGVDLGLNGNYEVEGSKRVSLACDDGYPVLPAHIPPLSLNRKRKRKRKKSFK